MAEGKPIEYGHQSVIGQNQTLPPLVPDYLREQTTVPLIPESKGYNSEELIGLLMRDGQNPTDFMVDRIRNGTRVIHFGEYHQTKGMHQPVTDIIHALAEDPALPQVGTLGIELSKKCQKAIDRYLATGKVTRLLIRILFSEMADSLLTGNIFEFMQMLKSAREHNVRVVCMDVNGNYLSKDSWVDLRIPARKRDALMHKQAIELAMEDSKSDKVTIIYQGNRHVDHRQFEHPTKGAYKLPYPKLSDVLSPDKYLSIFQETLSDLPSSFPKAGLILPVGNDEKFQRTVIKHPYLPEEEHSPLGNYYAVLVRPR